jgi:phosphatidate cytidylyltransferase
MKLFLLLKKSEKKMNQVNLSNRTTRIIVSIVAIPAIIAAAYFGKVYFFLFTLLVSIAAFIEFSFMAENKGIKVNLIPGIIAVLIIFYNQYYTRLNYYEIFLAIVLLLLLTELFRNKGSAILNLGATLIGITYIGLFGSALLSIRELYPDIGDLYSRGGFIIITIFASIWICDSAAYFGGSAYGKHKLYPRVSPNKSWEGAVFGFIFAIITAAAAKVLVLDFLSWRVVISIGLIVGIIGQMGDLVESLLKRDAGVKDSSSLIPGHGGIFDRFDSILMTAPAVYILLRYFGK